MSEQCPAFRMREGQLRSQTAELLALPPARIWNLGPSVRFTPALGRANILWDHGRTSRRGPAGLLPPKIHEALSSPSDLLKVSVQSLPPPLDNL